MDAELVIVGAGPAGASTALHLGRLDPGLARRTLILDKARHPRHKLCGGGLVGDGVRILAGLGLDLAEVPHVEAPRAWLRVEGRGHAMTLDRIAFRVVRRPAFDAWLAQKAQQTGARLEEGVEVRAVRPGAEAVEVETDHGTLRARLVVGADGSLGATRKAVGIPSAGRTARLVEVITPPPAAGQDAEATFEFGPIFEGIQGYFWSFPTLDQGRPARTWGVYDSRVAGGPTGGSLRPVCARHMAAHGLRLEEHRLEGHPLRWYDAEVPLAVPRLLLAGDAAGADPLFGEGISIALGYGRLAAEAVKEAFDREDFRLAAYTRRVARSPLGRALRWRAFTASILYHPRNRFWMRPWLRHGGPLIDAWVRRCLFGWAR